MFEWSIIRITIKSFQTENVLKGTNVFLNK